MKLSEDNNQILVRYLLGESSEEEQEGIEQRYISDPDFYEQLLIAEDDLIDSYAEGALSEPRRASFESYFLRSPQRQARVDFARAWIAYVSKQGKQDRPAAEPPERRFGFFRFESWPIGLRLAAALPIVLAVALPIAVALRLRNQLEQATVQRVELERNQYELQQQIDEERRRSEVLSSELARELATRDPQVVPTTAGAEFMSFLLTAGGVRGAGDAKRLTLTRETRRVSLQVRLRKDNTLVGSTEANGYVSYVASIKTVSGTPIWNQSGLRAQSLGSGKFVIVPISAALLSAEDYILTLNGVTASGSSEPVADYFFSVSKQ